MPRDTKDGRGRWKSAKSTKPAASSKQAKKWTAISILGILLTGSALGAVYLLLVFTGWFQPHPQFVPFWVGRHDQPRIAPVAWIDADRRAIRDGNYFLHFDESDFADPNLEKMGLGVAALGNRDSRDGLVVHFSGYAVVVDDDSGKGGPVRILAKDSNPSDPDTMLPLRSILKAFADCPSRKKLLILDIMKPRLDLYDLGGMGTSDGVSDLIRGEIDQIIGDKSDPAAKSKGLILVACAEGQNTVEIQSLGGSLFDHHFRAGLEDPAADANGDGQIRVKEVADYLGKMVNRDAFHYRGLRQTPELLGRGQDFALVAIGAKRQAKAAPAPEQVVKKEEPSAEKEKKDETAKGKEKDETKEKAQEKDKPAGKEAPAEENSDPRAYPSWLAAEWAEHKTIWDSGAYVDTPRPFRTVEALLIRAEQRWRGGDDPANIKTKTLGALDDIKKELKAREATWPTPRSVGQARAIGLKPDDALITELKATFRRRREPDPFAKPEQKAEALTAAVKAFLAKLKGKTMLDLAGAMVEVLASADERFDADTVKFADSIVGQAIKADTSLQIDVIEVRFLGLLARRAELPGEPWSEETARRAWDVVVQAEQANCQPRSLPWVKGLLGQADSFRHVAEALTLPRTAGYASWKQIDAAWSQARSAYEFVINSQRKIDAAQATLARARAFLPAHIPFLETSFQPDLEKIWLEASVKTRTLGDLLKLPTEETSEEFGAGPAREAIERLNDDLGEATQALADLLDELKEPFSTTTLQKLVQDCRSEQEKPNPELAVRIEAILSTPFASPEERRSLWDAGRDLDRRLAKISASDPAETGDASARLRVRDKDRINRATARAVRLAALINLAGDETTAEDMDGALRRTLATAEGRKADTPSATDAGPALAIWRLMSGRCANVRRDLKKLLDVKLPEDNRAAWVAPVDDLKWREHPVVEGRDLRNRAVLVWLGSRYRHEKEDARDAESASFFGQLESECLLATTPPRDLYPELSTEGATGAQRLNLSADHTRENLPFQIILRAPAEVGPRKVSLRVLKPDDDRLRVTFVGETELELAPQVAQTSNVRVEWIEGGIRPAGPSTAPSGFIIQARLGDALAYHLPIPLAIVPESERIQLALSSAPDRLAEVPFDLRLRAIPERQKFFVYVKNPSATPRNLIVEILEGGSVVPGTEAKLTVAARATEKVKAFGAAPIPATEALHTLSDPPQLQVRLKDAATGEVYQLQKMAVDLASPRDYLEDAGARFTPPQPGEANRLELKFRARPTMTAPPAPIAMNLDRRLIPALTGTPKELKREGSLEPGGEVTLYAGGLGLDPVESTLGLIPVDVDGLKRAFWFRTRFEQAGGPQRAELINKPRIYFEATPVLKPKETAKLKVVFQVDDAPPGARLRWQIGRVVDGKLDNDLSPFERPAKDRRIAFDARGADGALLFEASSKDWEPEFNIASFLGARRLQAKLLGPDGRTELADFAIDKVLDDKAPTGIALSLPKEVRPKTVMAVTANVPAPAAGLKEVVFFYGKGNPDDFKKAQDDNKLAKGKLNSDRDWEANLVIPETASGTLVVSVRALSNVDLAGFATDEVAITPPKPAVDPDEAAAKAAMDAKPKVGEIAGKITEGDRPQPDLTIYVRLKTIKAGTDAKVASAKSAKDGTYSFKDLAPETYLVWSANPSSSTNAVTEATVEAGKTATVNLDLVR